MNENILKRPYISFHGIGDFNFLKLKSILEKGILPNVMLPDIKPRNELMGNTDTKVYLVKSPSLVGTDNARAYKAYIQDSIAIAISKFPLDPNQSILNSFPDAGYLEGKITPNSFIGITLPMEYYNRPLSEIPNDRLVTEESEPLTSLVKDIIARYNTSGLPIYDSLRGERIDVIKKEIDNNDIDIEL